MRLFTAIDLPAELLAALGQLIGRLRPTARIKWSTPENIHLTTKFIGEWREERLGELEAALAALPARDPIEIQMRGLGFFPNPHHPRVFWAAVHAPAALAELVRQTEDALARLGIPRESRPFSPHLTLARIKEPAPMRSLQQAIASLPSTDFGSFTVDRFYLYQSRLSPAGSVYTRLSDHPLRK
ncbi:MAG: RNA 2',3'-cyclic phosphodiesterase [Bryobacteraceae bacterium]|jgi:2'-5' RNA ligase